MRRKPLKDPIRTLSNVLRSVGAVPYLNFYFFEWPDCLPPMFPEAWLTARGPATKPGASRWFR